MLRKKVVFGVAALLLGSSVGLAANVIDYGGGLTGNAPAASSSVTLNWDTSTFNVTDKSTNTIISSSATAKYSPYTVTINFGTQSGNTLNVSSATINLVEKNLAGTTTLASYSGSYLSGGFNTSTDTFDLKFTNGGDWSGRYTPFMGQASYNADLVVAPVPSALYGAGALVAGLLAFRSVRRRSLV